MKIMVDYGRVVVCWAYSSLPVGDKCHTSTLQCCERSVLLVSYLFIPVLPVHR